MTFTARIDEHKTKKSAGVFSDVTHVPR